MVVYGARTVPVSSSWILVVNVQALMMANVTSDLLDGVGGQYGIISSLRCSAVSVSGLEYPGTERQPQRRRNFDVVSLSVLCLRVYYTEVCLHFKDWSAVCPSVSHDGSVEASQGN